MDNLEIMEMLMVINMIFLAFLQRFKQLTTVQSVVSKFILHGSAQVSASNRQRKEKREVD